LSLLLLLLFLLLFFLSLSLPQADLSRSPASCLSLLSPGITPMCHLAHFTKFSFSYHGYVIINK
jgi:hypothetical protein